MDKKEQILHYHRIDGLSQREIARRVGVSRKTVKRYITEYETLAQSDPEEGINMCLASEPKYPTRKIERTRLTEPVCAEIEYWLSENARRRLTGMRKQCLKKQDIHRALIEKGFNISYSSVCKYIQQRKAEKSKKPKDVFVKQYYEPGEECEFDWGEVKLRIGGKPVTFTMAVFALCHSEGRWAYLFRHQDHLAGESVIVQLYSEKIRVYDSAHKKVAEHERSYSSGSWTFDINHYINTLMKKPGALKGSVALRQMPEKMRELFRVHFEDNGKDFLKLLKYCRENSYDYKDMLDAVRKIRMRGARHINFDQIKVALEMRGTEPLVFMDSQMTDDFLEIELGSEDVLSQLDSIMQSNAEGRNRL